jgi:phospholipase C
VTGVSAILVCAFASGGLRDGGGSSGSAADDTDSPIKHVILVGENRSFDHLFATYVPKHPEEGIHNLLWTLPTARWRRCRA